MSKEKNSNVVFYLYLRLFNICPYIAMLCKQVIFMLIFRFRYVKKLRRKSCHQLNIDSLFGLPRCNGHHYRPIAAPPWLSHSCCLTVLHIRQTGPWGHIPRYFQQVFLQRFCCTEASIRLQRYTLSDGLANITTTLGTKLHISSIYLYRPE